MPDISGLDVLRRIEQERPDLRVIIITAHGTVDAGVESMKLGAVDFLQKPFSVEQVRALVRHELDPAERTRVRSEAYEREVALARDEIGAGRLDVALAHLRRAEGLVPDRPEAFNLQRRRRRAAPRPPRGPEAVPGRPRAGSRRSRTARDNLHASTRREHPPRAAVARLKRPR